jgi:acyl carrier protein
MSSPVDSTVLRIIADIFAVPQESLRPESSPETIETWDSLAHLNLILALEQEFQIQFPPEEIETLVTVERISSAVTEKLAVTEPD